MTAVITGASGLLGGNLAAMLLSSGVAVRATKRATTKAPHLADLAIEWVDAELTDVASLTRAFTGADVVFHCAGHATQTHRLDGPHRATNVEGTRNVVAAVAAAGAHTKGPRLVHVSSVVACAIAADGAPDVDETMPWNFADYGLDEAYAATKHEGEQIVLAAARDGTVDAVVVNPGLMVGPRDAKPSTGRLVQALAHKKIAACPSGFTTVVDVRDVCRGMIAAWTQGKRAERYILGGLNMSYADLFALVCAALDMEPPRMALPDFVVRIGGALGDAGERLLGRELELNSAITAYSTCRGYRFSSQKAMRELGFTLSPLDDAMRDAVAWYRAHGMLPRVRRPGGAASASR